MTRLRILALATVVLANCQHSGPPTSPAGLPSPSPASQPAARVVVEGAYTLTFIADETCVLLPRDVRSRTYTAAVTQDRPQDIGTFFTAQLGGASFYPQYDAFFIRREIGNVARFYLYSVFASRQWLDDIPVYERLASGGFVAISGIANVPFDTSGPSASVPFPGLFAYCASPTDPKDPYPPDCSKPVVCESSTHTLALVRR